MQWPDYYSFSTEGQQLTIDLILEVTQICCFPFAVDTSEDLLVDIQRYAGPEDIKLLSCSTQLSMKFILLKNIKIV